MTPKFKIEKANVAGVHDASLDLGAGSEKKIATADTKACADQ